MIKEIEVVVTDYFISGDVDEMNKCLNRTIRNYINENDIIINIESKDFGVFSKIFIYVFKN